MAVENNTNLRKKTKLNKNLCSAKYPDQIYIYVENVPTISDKNFGKNCYLENFAFLSPVPPLNNVDEQ